jgi:hypothetical protein
MNSVAGEVASQLFLLNDDIEKIIKNKIK